MRETAPAGQHGAAVVEERRRPARWEEFAGQPTVTTRLQVITAAARAETRPCPHLLLSGPAGLGKTTLAGIVAGEMGGNLRTVMGPTLGKVGDMVAILAGLENGDVLFVDELHRLRKPVEEILYPAMEDGHVDVVLGEGPSARTVRLELEPFTLIGATTRTGMLSAPLRDRFGHVAQLEPYDPATLSKVVARAAELDGWAITPDGALAVGVRGRGVPRVALQLLDRCTDYARVRGLARIDAGAVAGACDLFGVDARGLDKLDRDVLEVLAVRFGGSPVGLSTICGIVDEDPRTIEESVEPYLMRLGFVARTPRGRQALPPAWAHLGIPYNGGGVS